MILNQESSNLEANLKKILKDLRLKSRNKSELLSYYVELRLNNSLKNYYDSILELYNKLNRKKELSLIKEINKK